MNIIKLIIFLLFFSSCIVEYKENNKSKIKVEERISQIIRENIEKDSKFIIIDNKAYLNIVFNSLPNNSYLFYMGSIASMLILEDLELINDLDTIKIELINIEKNDTVNLSYKIADLSFVKTFYGNEVTNFVDKYSLQDWSYISRLLVENDTSGTLDLLIDLRSNFKSIKGSSINGFYYYKNIFIILIDITNENNESYSLKLVYNRNSNKIMEIGINDLTGLR